MTRDGRRETRSPPRHPSPPAFRARVVDVVDVVDRPPYWGNRPLPRPFDRIDRATDSTETASFRFARFRPPKRDSVDSVVMSTGRLAGGAAPFSGLSTESTPDRLDRDGLLPLRALQAAEAQLGRFCRFGRVVDPPPCGGSRPARRPRVKIPVELPLSP